ncbi:hypothetical protein JS531_03010 [Bifidobacterium sp. CP2]|uniref:hypothetical protein n=1 Tax=Bifidobacterium sp. CP2 TaxID=2809025 RepID=UPI001BDC378B|nr:hypothetical protein [Bifidobacterium sp. CP2]MBT1180955.1 hypothetical protein [Bifidobacterium sp. CP2]
MGKVRSTGDGHGADGRFEQLAKPWISRFVADTDRRYVSERQTPRAVNLISGIVREATSRGFDVPAPSKTLLDLVGKRRWPWPHVLVDLGNGRMASFHLAEASMSLAPPGADGKDETSDGMNRDVPDDGNTGDPEPVPLWMAERSRAFVASGVLGFVVDSDMDYTHRKSSKDSSKSLVESRLPSVFDSLVACVVRQRDMERVARMRRASLERAQRECRGEQLYTALCEEVHLYEDLRAQRAYLDRVEQRMRLHDPDGLQRGAGTIRMMRERIDARDPLLAGGAAWMRLPEPSEAEVFAYMRRGSRLSAFEEDQLTRRRPGARDVSSPSADGSVSRFFD